MSLFKKKAANIVARDLIFEAIKGGSIKLLGCAGASTAVANSSADATYLSNLMIQLSEKLTNEDSED